MLENKFKQLFELPFDEPVKPKRFYYVDCPKDAKD